MNKYLIPPADAQKIIIVGIGGIEVVIDITQDNLPMIKNYMTQVEEVMNG